MRYRIRPFRTDDGDALAGVFAAAIAVIGRRAYSCEQVAAWAARGPGPDAYVARASAGDVILVAVDETDRPVAYAILDRPHGTDAHLDHLYCDPAHTRRGLAERLLAAAEERSRATGATRLYSEASEVARPAFEREGYRVMHRRKLELDGVTIHNFAMEKMLPA